MQAPNTVRRRIVLGAALAFVAILSGCGNRTPAASTPTLKILYNTEEEPAEKSAIAQVLQSQLTKAGIPGKLQRNEKPVMATELADCLWVENRFCQLV
jgi:hypothetical protein